MKIPVCEPYLNGNEVTYVLEAVKSGWISSSGNYVIEFEKEFAKLNNAKYAISTTSGTAALHLALVAMGITKGDEVIIPNFTMSASAFAICYTGATPVFIDADKNTWNIDSASIKSKITEKTKAIMSVPIFGNPCQMDELHKLAMEHNLLLIDDTAEGLGAKLGDRLINEYVDVSAFSFFANKHITTGEGGMVVTNNEEIAEKCKYFKNMCFSLNGNRDYIHNDIGFNYRMSNLLAAVGLAQTQKANDYISLRIRNGELYRRSLLNVEGITLQKPTDNAQHVYWMNAIMVDTDKFGMSRDELRTQLEKLGIETRLLFTGMHQQPSLQKYGCDCNDEYYQSEKLTKNGFYLPSASSLSEADIDFICTSISKLQKLN